MGFGSWVWIRAPRLGQAPTHKIEEDGLDVSLATIFLKEKKKGKICHRWSLRANLPQQKKIKERKEKIEMHLAARLRLRGDDPSRPGGPEISGLLLRGVGTRRPPCSRLRGTLAGGSSFTFLSAEPDSRAGERNSGAEAGEGPPGASGLSGAVCKAASDTVRVHV